MVINSSDRICISFIFNPFFYNTMYPSWLATSYGCPCFTMLCGHINDNLGTHLFRCPCGGECTRYILGLLFWKVEHMFRRNSPSFSFATPNEGWIFLSLNMTFRPWWTLSLLTRLAYNDVANIDDDNTCNNDGCLGEDMIICWMSTRRWFHSLIIETYGCLHFPFDSVSPDCA